MIVCIAEKPSVAKDIARIIGATVQRNGFFEGNGFQVTWTYGRLCELKEPADYTPAWKPWTIVSLPMIPHPFGIRLINKDYIKQQFSVIQQLFKHADSIINLGDAGQEGELIQRWVMQKAGVTCPVKRLWISSLTDDAIREGFNNLKEQSHYDSLYSAGLCRALGDWLLGMNATRLYTLKYGYGYRRGRPTAGAQPSQGQLLSVGRVQTPTLALIVERQKEIDHFIPVRYWALTTVYRGTAFSASKGRFDTKEEGAKILALIKNKPFTITKTEKKRGRESPPQLYDLTSLQVDCNKRYAMTAETTLNTAQYLYECKLITYPRVDTRYLPDDMHDKCGQILFALDGYQHQVGPLKGKRPRKSRKVFDSSKVTDHHAIIPAGIAAYGMNETEQHVYDMITRRFIASFYPDCEYAVTTVTGKVDDVEFKVSGKEIIQAGWRALLNTQENANNTLPSFTEGESGPHTPSLTEKQTAPPKYYTEATLLRAMETAGKLVDDEQLRAVMKDNGIGRPSSRAAIIETLFQRGYIRRIKKNIIATPQGVALIDTIKEPMLKSPELTGLWEKKLRDIEHGKYESGIFIGELKEMITTIVNDVVSDRN